MNFWLTYDGIVLAGGWHYNADVHHSFSNTIIAFKS
ncbi:unnamed protein product, partial [marine sediment metagenome]